MQTYRARYWSTTNRPMLGGVMSSRSSVFDTREEAELRLAVAIEVNAEAGRPVAGEIEAGEWPAEILHHQCAPDRKARRSQVVGCVCFDCHQRVTR